MGRIIDSWIENELPKIQMILSPPRNLNQPGIQQPEGATTFPMEMGGPQQVQQTFGSPPSPGLPENWQSQIPRSPQAQRFAEQNRNASSTFEVPSRGRRVDPENIESFDDLMAAAPEQAMKGVDILTQHLGGEEGVDRAYQQATGQPPPQGLSRQEKGMLLMEFGLRTLAHNQDENSLGAVGRAGVETLGSYRAMKKEKETAPEEARRRQLENNLLEAQINKAKNDTTQLKADREGNLRLINMVDGTSRMVLDEEGNPVQEDANSSDFASEVDRGAYQAAFCEGLDGAALQQCKQRAVMFSKGGAAELVFPDLTRNNITMRLLTMMENSDNRSMQYTLRNGTTKRWREMSGDEQLEAADLLADKWMDVAGARATGARSAAPSRDNNWGLTKEQLDSFPEGKRTRLPNGVILSRRQGRVMQVDEQGNEIQ